MNIQAVNIDVFAETPDELTEAAVIEKLSKYQLFHSTLNFYLPATDPLLGKLLLKPKLKQMYTVSII